MSERLGPAELASLLPTVRAAVAEAAALVAGAHRRALDVRFKGPVDLVTEYDHKSEELLRERLSATGIAVVGEEQGGDWDRARPAFFVDPIDGTTNFVHGHPFWCVSVGLVIDEAPALGVVRAPSLGLEWEGIARDGVHEAQRRALSSGEGVGPCRVSPTADLKRALLATGFPYDRHNSPDNNFDTFVAIKAQCQAVRRCGSAALDLCLVADGTYEGYWERTLKPWDLAGGAAIVLAAGGDITDYDGRRSYLTSGDVVATNGALHQALLEELARVHSTRSLSSRPPPAR